jgi:hypothetical protein
MRTLPQPAQAAVGTIMTSGDANLWRQVLLLAVTDALIGSTDGGSCAVKIKATHKAGRYFTTPNADFKQVCHMANLDPIAVRDAVAKQIAAAPAVEDLFQMAGRRHSRANARPMTYNGETLSVDQIAQRTGLSRSVIKSRHTQNWSTEGILTTPTRQTRRWAANAAVQGGGV